MPTLNLRLICEDSARLGCLPSEQSSGQRAGQGAGSGRQGSPSPFIEPLNPSWHSCSGESRLYWEVRSHLSAVWMCFWGFCTSGHDHSGLLSGHRAKGSRGPTERCCFFFFYVYLFFERERKRAPAGRGREREEDRGSKAGSVLTAESQKGGLNS